MTLLLNTPHVLNEMKEKEEKLVLNVLESLLNLGVTEFCLCPGSRNAPLVYPLANCSKAKLYNWPEERSAAFFALGRIKALGHPVAVVTTSGTAVAELLPAVIEAFYSGLPLILITADRPKYFRGSGAPQSIEQAGIFSHFLHGFFDLESGESLDLDQWSRRGPLHLNICLEEPKESNCRNIIINEPSEMSLQCNYAPCEFFPDPQFLSFLKTVKYPQVIVGGLPSSSYESVVQFLLRLQAPVYLEAISGIREDARLKSLQIMCGDELLTRAKIHCYPIDGVLRIGSIPTLRFWRDLEELKNLIPVYSISHLPFSGLSTKEIVETSIPSFLEWAQNQISVNLYPFEKWRIADQQLQKDLYHLFNEEPLSEPALFHALSDKIPVNSKIYLGNSSPIREWDFGASRDRIFKIAANRGANGIDGQLATFLGFSTDEQDNWAILGDLTTIYDMAAPWITSQLGEMSLNLVVINNGGGAIFSRMYSHPIFLNSHKLSFKPLADFWGWAYERWETIPNLLTQTKRSRLIELFPCPHATDRFWKKFNKLVKV